MTQLRSAEIENICFEIYEEIYNKYPYYRPHLYFLYYYGVRINEVFNYRISIASTGSQISILPQKNNTERILPVIDEKTFYWVEQLQLSQENQWLNKKNLERIIKKIMPIRNLRVGNKNVGCHLFRHNYIKKLVANGFQFMTIDSMLGYTTQSVADTYAISVIHYN